jgi:regulator of replication initiation timing
MSDEHSKLTTEINALKEKLDKHDEENAELKEQNTELANQNAKLREEIEAMKAEKFHVCSLFASFQYY